MITRRRAAQFAFTLCTALAGRAAPCLADPSLPALFSDHMVLQRDRPIHLWGSANPGERLSITFNGAAIKTRTSDEGRWTATLPSMPAGGPFRLVVKGNATVVVEDVLIGEVWIASGQSNMDYALAGSTGAAAELQQANRPAIRLFKVPRRSSLTSQDSVSASWALCSPGTARDFSAVAYYFARDLNLALHVPIGIVQASWSGSLAEEWTDRRSLENSPVLEPILDRWRDTPQIVKDFAQHGSSVDLQFDGFSLIAGETGPPTPRRTSPFDDGRAPIASGGLWRASPPGVLEVVSSGRDGSPYTLHLSGNTSLEALPALRTALKAESSPATGNVAAADLSSYRGIRFNARGKGCFHTQLEVPAIVDGDSYSSQTVCATDAWSPVTVLFRELKQAGWGVKRPLTLDRASALSIAVDAGVHGEGQRPPSGLFNGMIAPLTAYTMRGAIWYQGEGNSDRADQYRTLLPAMIGGWRNAWSEPEFPFLIVQLPNLGPLQTNSEESNWAELREAQRLTAKAVAHTGLAVTIDLGEAGNLHPPRKAEVGQRLALQALGLVYALPLEYSGPQFESSEVERSSMRLHFSHAKGLSARGGGALTGFSIAGANQKLEPATASIRGADVIVSSPLVPHPLYARYAWAGNPACNLVNGADLPASPFRTDLR